MPLSAGLCEGEGSRLVNGTDCERHSRPRQGALLPGPNKLYCGAVLGDSPWLLTAARCRKVLQCLNITVLSDDRCKTAYPNQIGDTMLCAGDQAGRDSCKVRLETSPFIQLKKILWSGNCINRVISESGKGCGDSGGPVVCSGSLQGLVSWGDLPCTQPNRPGVYTNLRRFSKWTQDTMQSNS
uniref:Kallikrein related peptidase 5 n=1 Tax=Balaenoptera musculus TaxID=9771 RepID=A0A8C0DMS3_BALMU